MNQSLSVLLLLILGVSLTGQNIYLDEAYGDWDNSMLVYTDSEGDGPSNGIDLHRVWAANDQDYFFIRMEVGRELNIQDDNELTLYIDADNNLNTGRKINGIGAELEWVFGDRSGRLYRSDGDDTFLAHEDFDLMSSPTVSSDQFEVGFRREFFEDGISFEMSETIAIRIEDNGPNGDDAPSSIGGIEYQVSNYSRDLHTYSVERPVQTDLRVMTLNILNDNMFDPVLRSAFSRQFQLIDPDIIALQEVRDFSSSQAASVVSEFLPGLWFHDKSSFGNVVLLSRFPILDDESIDGNKVYLINALGQEVVIVNMHLPCCDNNVSRQQEVDGIMRYIRQLKAGDNDMTVDDNTPIIIMGDSNLVGGRQQQQTLLTGDIQNNSVFGPDVDPDWDGSDLEDARPLATGSPYTKTWYNPFGSFSSGRLDYIIYTGSVLWLHNAFALSSRDMTATDRQTYGLQFSDSERASDHLPIVADFQFVTVSTTDVDERSIEVYPNPTDGLITVVLGDESISSVKLYDQVGRLVLATTNGSLDLTEVRTGTYTLVITTDEGSWVEKVVKL